MNKCGQCGKETDDLITSSEDFIPKCKYCRDKSLTKLINYMRAKCGHICPKCGKKLGNKEQ